MVMKIPAVKSMLGIAPERSLPEPIPVSLRRYVQANFNNLIPNSSKSFYLFIDEFVNYNDESVGQKAVQLLDALGYNINIIEHPESGRAAFSKGFLDHAKQCANENVRVFSEVVNEGQPLVGIEPSAILGFRDEYPKIVDETLIEKAELLAKNVFTIEEFLYQEVENGNITSASFDSKEREILVHGHCHQKALSSVDYTAHILSVPSNNKVSIIPSGCCGMAGSFGYEKEHYAISLKIGEQTLFPAVREASKEAIIAASGTSCRHQIKDGTSVKSYHPVEILFDCLSGD
jgi:Fe-S oxidoreductase